MPILYIILTISSIYIAADILVPHLSYLKWDNFEFIVPAIIDAHTLWLKGIFPVWTTNVHLGDPLISNGQLGVFYFPHTAILLILNVLHIPYSWFPALSLVLHSAIIAIAWYTILRRWSIRPFIASLAVMAIVFGGMIQFNSQIWTDMLPTWSWFAVLLVGVEISNLTLIAISIALGAAGGHPQQFFYQMVFILLWLVANQIIYRSRLKTYFKLAFGGIIGCLLAMPSMLPIFSQKSYSARATDLSLENFIARGASWKDLLGIANPFLKGTQSVMPIDSSTLLFQSFWIIPGIILGFLYLKKNVTSELQKKFLICVIVGFFGLLLAMGGNTPLYAWTYRIPMWSSFRWPFKMLYFCLPIIVAAAAVGWEFAATKINTKYFQISFLGTLLFFALSFLLAQEIGPISDVNTSGILLLTGSFLCFILSGIKFLLKKTWQKELIVCSILASCIGTIVITQTNRNKTYTENYASVGPADLGLTTTDRVLPLTTYTDPPLQQDLAFMHSGPMNQYESATGCVTALAPKWRLKALPADVYGVLDKDYAKLFLKSNLINTLNIGYIVAGKKDPDSLSVAGSLPSLQKIRETPNSFVYRNTRVLPKVFFAEKIVPNDEETFQKIVMSSNYPADNVVTDSSEAKFFQKNGSLLNFSQNGGQVLFEANNLSKTTQFAVISVTWYPSWRAYVSGIETHIFRVNETIMGIEIPPGNHKIELKWQDPMLKIGLVAGILGILLWISLFFISKLFGDKGLNFF